MVIGRPGLALDALSAVARRSKNYQPRLDLKVRWPGALSKCRESSWKIPAMPGQVRVAPDGLSKRCVHKGLACADGPNGIGTVGPKDLPGS